MLLGSIRGPDPVGHITGERPAFPPAIAGRFMSSSAESSGPVPSGSLFVYYSPHFFVFCLAWLFWATPAAAQASPQQQAPALSSATPSGSQQDSAELATRDEPTTFKVNVKLVVVRAVVRDSQG